MGLATDSGRIGICVLACIPDDYLSHNDRFVRLPSMIDKEADAEGNRIWPRRVPVFSCGDPDSFEMELRCAGLSLVVVKFTATWCGACQRIKPDLAQLAK